MRLPILLAAALFAPAVQAQYLAFVGANVITDADADPRPNAVVLIKDDRVVAIEQAGAPLPSGTQVVDVGGAWIVPGLIDAHVHFFQSGGAYTRPDIIDLRAVRSYETEVASIRRNIGTTLARYIASGVTAVADFGGPRWNFSVRARAADSISAPTVKVAGPLLATWVPDALSGKVLNDPPMRLMTGENNAVAAVKAQLADDPDFVKIWFIHWPGDDLAAQTQIVSAAIEAAHAGGKRVVVHATQLAVARAAVAAGADILAHSIEDQKVDESFAQELRERGVIYVTTLVVNEGYDEVLNGRPRLNDVERRIGDPKVIATFGDIERYRGARAWHSGGRHPDSIMAANLRRLARAGVTVAAGTDAGNIGTLHGPALHRELELMTKAGLAPREALRAATLGGARVLGPENELGKIAPGYLADLVVLDGNPLDDISNTQRIRWIVKDGRVFSQDTALRGKLARARAGAPH